MMIWWVIIVLGVIVLGGLMLALSKISHSSKLANSGNHPAASDAGEGADKKSAKKDMATSHSDSSDDKGHGDAKAEISSKKAHSTDGVASLDKQAFDIQAEQDVEHIFNDTFREELRNRGRLHFEKIIGENAMFLQQDLRLTTSQLNDYMKEEITTKLKEEFTKYEQSIVDAKEVAIDAIEKTKQAVEDNRATLLKQLEQEFAEEKAREIKRFDENMTDVINHYLVAAIGDQIDLSDQFEYIIANLEANKKAIIQDLINGA
jgi:hypothetical protein